MREDRDLMFDAARFRALTDACEDTLLIEVPKGSREELRSQAVQSTSRLMSSYTDRLGDIEPIARADLVLRTLMVLVLEAASRPYVGETRLPDWDKAIDEANAELEAAETGLRQAAEAI